MPTRTDRLGLLRHTSADRFRVAEYTENWERIDGSPGLFLCTSTTRPLDWGPLQTGRGIFETDTRLTWRWDGTVFYRSTTSRGHLGSNERTTDLSNTSTAYAIAVQASVTISSGNRPHLVIVEGPGVASTTGLTGIALVRDGTTIQEWEVPGGTSATVGDRPRPLTMTALDIPPAGAALFSLQFRAIPGTGGTSTLKAATNAPLGIHVVEI